MPPKIKVTKEDIIRTSVELVRRNGDEAINARLLAASLNCSTQPIFSNFASMKELQSATIHASYEIYQSFLKKELEHWAYPKYKAFGMGYIRFAMEERELFKLLFMRDRTDEDKSLTPDFKECVQMIMDANGVSYETAELIHLEIWIFVHGIATMIATSFLALDLPLISDMLTDVYHGILERHRAVGAQNGSNQT